ncbi:hypothetical protein U1Q18_051244 [Sarracenia purpurea var. burkii]
MAPPRASLNHTRTDSAPQLMAPPRASLNHTRTDSAPQLMAPPRAPDRRSNGPELTVQRNVILAHSRNSVSNSQSSIPESIRAIPSTSAASSSRPQPSNVEEFVESEQFEEIFDTFERDEELNDALMHNRPLEDPTDNEITNSGEERLTRL